MISRWKPLIILVSLFPALVGQISAQEKMIPIAEQESLLYNSIEKALKNHPEVAKDTRDDGKT